MKSWLLATGLVLSFAALQPQEKRDWVDPDTGHRVVRLTDDAGGSTLYFHDNAFSPKGDTLMFNTPSGIAELDVSKIGSGNAVPQIVARGRGGHFSRRSREIYFTNAEGRGSDTPISAVNVDTKQVRQVAHARGLINADESLSLVKNANAIDTEGNTPSHRCARPGRSCSACFPESEWRISHPISRCRQEGGRPGAASAESESAVIPLHQPEDRRRA